MPDVVRLQQLLAEARDELHHKHGPDDGDTCFACYLESEINRALCIDRPKERVWDTVGYDERHGYRPAHNDGEDDELPTCYHPVSARVWVADGEFHCSECGAQFDGSPDA